MRLIEPKRGDGDGLSVRIRKKHKRLDAISEDVFNRNRNRNVGFGSSEGNERVESGGKDDSELRRSSRVRRVPEFLDSSPPPKRKRKRGEMVRVGREGGCEGLRGKGKVDKEERKSCVGSSEEELGSWTSRLRMKGKQCRGKRKIFEDVEGDSEEKEEFGGENLGDGEESKIDSVGGLMDVGNEIEDNCSKGERLENGVDGLGNKEFVYSRLRTKGKRSHGERKILEGVEDDEDEVRTMEDDLEEKEECLGGERSGDEEGTKVKDDQSVGEKLANGVDDLGKEESDDCSPSFIGRVDVNEEIGSVILVEKERGVLEDNLIEEKIDTNEQMGESSQTDDPVNSHEPVQEAVTECQAKEIDQLSSDLAGNQNNNTTKDTNELEDRLKVKNSNVATSRIPRPRIKEGRQCGLCGGGTDGKPPKKLVTDSAGSDQEAYSGSSASEEFNYDAWDGFGDETGWLGRLLGPVNDRYGIAGIWVHQHCAVWSPEVYFAGLGCLKNIRAALCRGRALKCTRCGRSGATLGCRVDRCPRTYHLPCARASGCNFDHRKFLISCADHRYLFEPHGHQYSQHIKKLKAKKMKLEIRKFSNDASRKDLEAEEKWMEKCGEDEEFLKRETKRLQRDLLRIAPVYIGGSHPDAENPIGGWESVAGLQNVVQCMKEVVILPLLYPEFFDNMGITPPRGVLLHGYPGTGKTLVVRALIGSCARGDKRIAYFARKGADCLGKYVGDAERQLRLLFQVAEKSQPSIIFFDEIDGLAPVRTRQQDQTHSSVVSTLLALMDGLKSRGSVIVIGATNRPDSIDPALRRPGRFDREIYFPLPPLKDRASILALHTRKWPMPVSGPLLEWVATETVGFAGADLQALCAQAAVIALKRNCSWNKILSCASENNAQGRRPELPSFEVAERDWLEALSLAPPPCSRREAGMAANEVLGTPLDMHLIPCLLQPLLRLILSLYLDDRLWLPLYLIAAGRAIKKAVVSRLNEKNLENGIWSCLEQHMAEDPKIVREIVRSLLVVGIVKRDASLNGFDMSEDASFDGDETHECGSDDNPSGLIRNVRCAPLKKRGYRIMISGAPRSGQKHLASCLLHCFLGNVEIQKVDLATISQEGHGNMERGILHILMKCTSMRMCVIFMPRIDFWAIESCSQSVEQDVEVSPFRESQVVDDECSSRPLILGGIQDSQNEIYNVSKTWRIFREQLACLCASSSLIILATSELPCAALPCEIRQFFGSESIASKEPFLLEQGTPQFFVEVDEELDKNEFIHLSAIDLSRKLIQQFVHVAHLGSHRNTDSSIGLESHFEETEDNPAHETETRKEPHEDSVTKLQVPSGFKNIKEKSNLMVAVTTFGYQILRFPHFTELCWVTSKLNEGPSADIRGPWKGWPFNSCIVRPCQLIQKDIATCNSPNINGKDKFTLVRGLVAVGLSAYRGVYKSSGEVSLEVRKVLELLVRQISARIQAGKDRYQYIRLLSQVAYLEDMVNNWSHSLRSFELEDQTQFTINISCNPCLEDRQAQTAESLGVEDKLNTGGSGFQETQLATGSMLGPTKAVDVGVDSQTDYGITNEGFAGKAVDVSVVNRTDSMMTDEKSPEKVVDLSIDNQTDFEITDEMPPEKAVNPLSFVNCTNSKMSASKDIQDLTLSQAASTKLVDQEVASPFKCATVELCAPTELCQQSCAGPMVQNDVNNSDCNLSFESSEIPTKLEVLCCYTCCAGCIPTLQEVVKKIIIQEMELSGSCCTVEDIHDLVSSLSTSLCSAVRNLSVTREFRNQISEKQNSGKLGNFESQISNACQCRSSEGRLTELMDCVCHSGKCFQEELKQPSSYVDQEFSPRYIFRNDVLVSKDPDKESSFHCKYDALCLCSLIRLILCNKQPID